MAPGTTGVVEATNPAPRLIPWPRRLVSDTSAPPQNVVAALVLGNSSLMTMVPRSSTSTTSTTPPRAGAARDRQPHVEEVSQREQPVAHRLDARIGGVDRGPLHQAQGRDLGDDDRLVGLVVAAHQHVVDDVAGAESLVGERDGGGGRRLGGRRLSAPSWSGGSSSARAADARSNPDAETTRERRIAGARGAAMRAA